MNKTALIMILGILGCGKAFAATELQLQQKRVMHFCANASLPLLIAGTTYANTSDNGRPEKERVAILKNSVASSTAYKMASPGVQMAMMSVVEDIADPKELALHQKEVRRLGASYLSDSGVSWASKTVSYQTSAMKFSNAFQKFKGLKLYLYLTVPARKVTFLNRNRLASLNFLNG
ncbi:TPA: hypothetical protein ACIICM_004078 [Salmonella enterica subsp. enterica serovar Typhimurium]